MKVWKKILLGGAFALVLGAGTGCSWMPWVEISQNVEHSKQLRIGMTKTEAQAVMGEPVSGESYCRPDVWFYYHNTVWADGLVTEDECMPLVFEDGKLVGWGNQFYAAYRIHKKDHGKELDLPAVQ